MRKPQNIVYVLSDQHNPNVAGFAGDEIVRTPHLDGLARTGVTFDNCYCSSPLCVPSRASLLSSLLPSRTGIFNNFQALPPHHMTFAHSLTLAGYETVLCGRMHFNGPDQRHGFEKRLVGDISPTYPGLPKNQEIWGDLLGTQHPSRKSVEKSGAGCSSTLQYDAAVTDAALGFLATRRDPRPLFLVVGYFGPHCPFVAPPELYDYYKKRLPAAPVVSPEFQANVHPAIRKWYKNRGVEVVSPQALARVRAAYYGMVDYLDSLVGQVLHSVTTEIGLDDTLIVYGSDHGEALGENGLFWKTNFSEGAARVPLVFSWPAELPSGVRVREPVSLMDMGPTFIEIGGAPALPATDGVSLADIVSGEEAADPNRPVLSQLADVKGDNPSRMVRKRQWKLIVHNEFEDVQLFDVEADPTEKTDLGRNSEWHEVVRELRADLDAVCTAEELSRLHEESARHGQLYQEWVRAVKQTEISGDAWYGEAARNYVLEEQ